MSLDRSETPIARRRRAPLVRCLITADEHSVAEAQAILVTLPLCATGRVFVEVPDEAGIGILTAPPRMTVTWLPRSRIGDRRTPRQRGSLLEAAVQGWSSEMLCDGEGVRAWLRGDYRGVQAAHEVLTERAGIDPASVDAPESYSLGGHTA